MDIASLFRSVFVDNYPLRIVTLGCGALGLVSGALGTFAVLRKQSLLGDAISHAALPGVALAFLLTHSKEPLLLGAAAAGWLGTLWVMAIVRTTRIKYDSALALMLSVFFGVGLMLVTYIQKRVQTASQAGLMNFMFGQAATLLWDDVVVIALLGGLALTIMLVFWKEFKLLSFDPDFGASLGFPIRLLDVLLTSLLVIAIVTGLQAVGAVLMSALIVAPAVAARQWTDRLGVMVLLSAFFGALAGVSGGLLSSSQRVSIPTGPTITLCASALVLLSLLFAPNRGLLWNWAYEMRNRRRLHLEAVLEDLYELSLHHQDLDHGHSVAVLQTMTVGGGVLRSLQELQARGWVRQLHAGDWSLTPAGRAEAERLLHSRGTS